MPRCQGYADLGDLSEDQRIQIIGKMVTEKRSTVAIAVETKAKADRYGKKLMLAFPDLIIRGLHPGLVKNTVLLRVGHKDVPDEK